MNLLVPIDICWIIIQNGLAYVQNYEHLRWETGMENGRYQIKRSAVYKPIQETYITLQYELEAAIENHNQSLAVPAGV